MNAGPIGAPRFSAGLLAFSRIPFRLLSIGVPMGPLALLETQGRRSGRSHRVPVVLLRSGEERWLVSPFGNTSWVLNVRAGSHVRLGRGRRLRSIELTELPIAERAPLLRIFRRRFGAIPFVRAAFDASGRDSIDAFAAEADRHPVFRITRTAA
ncbi:MAG: nitroreductase family deazaflavin-dependent oxidoreductase [Ilumatobacteraceae bacterium]|nr:nitroreductase family deazaflavin-dependent oxidoreductase [Ilumatobacteraceae bacterium]